MWLRPTTKLWGRSSLTTKWIKFSFQNQSIFKCGTCNNSRPSLTDIVCFDLLRIVVSFTILRICLLKRGFHALLRNASFPSLTDVGSHGTSLYKFSLVESIFFKKIDLKFRVGDLNNLNRIHNSILDSYSAHYLFMYYYCSTQINRPL